MKNEKNQKASKNEKTAVQILEEITIVTFAIAITVVSDWKRLDRQNENRK